MSFSSELKMELIKTMPNSRCCRQSMLYGMMECGRGFSTREMSIQTEQSAIADMYIALLWRCCKVPAFREDGGFTIVNVSENKRLEILEQFGHQENEISLRLNRAVFDCEKCLAAYLKGVFLACGNISDPNTDYHLELNIPSYTLSKDLELLLEEMELPAKRLRRKGDNVLYYKDSGQIEDFLAMIGASNAAMEMMNVKIMKEIRNSVNRANNCETANMDKTASAVAKQLYAIELIQKNHAISMMPEDLQQVAAVRIKNPEMSLRELSEQCDPPMSRSGLNHRLTRLIEFSKQFEQTN